MSGEAPMSEQGTVSVPAVATPAASVPLYIGSKEVAKMLGISKSTLKEARKRGAVGPKPFRLGTQILRWNRQEILEWAKAGCPDETAWEQRKAGAVNE
jgi:predicted DNA-binding transcriptional regulator AlpA